MVDVRLHRLGVDAETECHERLEEVSQQVGSIGYRIPGLITGEKTGSIHPKETNREPGICQVVLGRLAQAIERVP